MDKVLVTGGLGFVSSNLIKLLISKKYYVINIDKVSYASIFTMSKNFLNQKNINLLKQI